MTCTQKLTALKGRNFPPAFIAKYIYVLEQLELQVRFWYRLLQKISIINLCVCVYIYIHTHTVVFVIE